MENKDFIPPTDLHGFLQMAQSQTLTGFKALLGLVVFPLLFPIQKKNVNLQPIH
jgi:hypothetical protein